jgi:hypothetical protein
VCFDRTLAQYQFGSNFTIRHALGDPKSHVPFAHGQRRCLGIVLVGSSHLVSHLLCLIHSLLEGQRASGRLRRLELGLSQAGARGRQIAGDRQGREAKPVRLTRRAVAYKHSMSSSSRSRPMKLVNWTGKFVGPIKRYLDLKQACLPYASSWLSLTYRRSVSSIGTQLWSHLGLVSQQAAYCGLEWPGLARYGYLPPTPPAEELSASGFFQNTPHPTLPYSLHDRSSLTIKTA